METLIIIVAFWLILLGAYGVVSLIREPAGGGASTDGTSLALGRLGRRPQILEDLRSVERPTILSERRQARAPAAERPAINGLFSEVDVLRAQVEHLRTELTALSNTRPSPI